jgi:hypothetical protein
MKRYALLFCALLLLCLFPGCSRDLPTEPVASPGSEQALALVADPEVVAGDLVTGAGWLTESAGDASTKAGGSAQIGVKRMHITCERVVIVDDIVHYKFEIPVGFGPYDRIGLHRVVRESRPYLPIRTPKSVFLQHGDLIGFGKFLFGALSPSTADDHAVAVYLAQDDVDVWGIDQNWVLVPGDTMDFSFMADWDLQNQVDNLAFGMAVARFSRLLTGSGFHKMLLLGYSSGVPIGYALLNQETQRPPALRQVAGFIPADGDFKTDDESNRLASCATAAAYQDSLDAGIYQDGTALLWGTAAMLARLDPDGPSPIVPGFTNMQAILLAGAATYAVAGSDCCFHFVAGIFNEYGIPTGLQFTPVEGFLDFLDLGASYMPYLWHLEAEAVKCEEVDLPYDDHLGEIDVPVFYVGAGGGIGQFGLYTLGLLGSSDVSSLIVELYPPEAVAIEFGHTDMWSATNAPGLVWAPILDWINSHAPGGSGLVCHRD